MSLGVLLREVFAYERLKMYSFSRRIDDPPFGVRLYNQRGQMCRAVFRFISRDFIHNEVET